MKTAILAALLALAPTTAEAAVTFTFHGTTDAFNSYTMTNGNTVFDAPSAFSGSITIDTDATGANHATPDALDYDGEGSPFLTATFQSAGTTPILFTSGDFQHILQSDPDNGSFFLQVGWTLPDGDTSGLYFTGSFVPTIDVGGVLLPDLNQATDLQIGVSSTVTMRDLKIDKFASGAVTFGAVPEPASWTLMIAGFGAIGCATRRRRVAFVTA